MHVGIIANAPYPDENMFAREQGQALLRLGHQVTVFAPVLKHQRWESPAGITHVDVSWEDDAASLHGVAIDAQIDVAHLQQRRGVSRILPLPVPSVGEITSTSLRPFPLRHIALAMTMAELRRVHFVGCANPKLVGRGRPASFLAPNGYSSWAFAAGQLRAAEPERVDPCLAVYQGTFSSLRRLPRLLDAVARVRQQVPKARLVMVGGRGNADQDILSRRARALRLGESVEIRQRCGPEELVDLWSRAGLSVSWIPRSHGFDNQPPLKILDAQVARLPVLATKTQATAELLRGGGGVMTAFDDEAFAGAWAELLAGREAPPLLEPAAFCDERSWDAIVANVWLPRYRRLLGGDS